MARGTVGLAMNHFQTLPVSKFSALSKVIPTSMPITSLSNHFCPGLKASTKPYRPAPPARLKELQRRPGSLNGPPGKLPFVKQMQQESANMFRAQLIG